MAEESESSMSKLLSGLGGIFTKVRDWIVSRSGLEDFMGETKQKKVPKHALNPVYCLGGVTFVALVVLGLTGLYLAGLYRPTVLEAQQSIQQISDVPFGFYMKSIHSWAANLTIIAILLHTLRVFITGSYKKPREFTWLSGVILLVLTFSFVLTGYILPMDERADVTRETLSGVLGGVKDIPLLGDVFGWLAGGAQEALTGAYWLHVTLLPLGGALFLVFHFYMIRKHGISGPL
ncbi:MAG: cytochrome b N-terminal domain-containing protein [Methanobacteriota archaeon]|nr:MAG: cytochrome b N-terminal domain-containing protein [Euryarchaeota archaeon]